MPTLAQQKALAIIPHATGSLSCLGSCSILYDITWKERKRKLQRPYYRILLFLSIFDAVCSFSLALSTWPIPRGTEGVYGAIGNTQTCTAQGFFNQILLGSPLYNLMLAIYYLLLGRYNLSEEEIAKRYEVYMHITAIVPSVGLAIAGLPLALYNNANLWCWIAVYPSGSEDYNGHHVSELQCERGHSAWIYRWIFFYAPLWFLILVITIIMVMLTLSVRTEEKRYIELMMRQQSSDDIVASNSTEENKRPEVPPRLDIDVSTSEEAFHLERSRKMFYQATFYVGAFYLAWYVQYFNQRNIEYFNCIISIQYNPKLLPFHSVIGGLRH
mmetsp:Transcript_11307/g.21364  ORF Transcript_11307/g.21364 Transcript_11307/m.21364 type:complete len:328 (-) Transcript_11307:395-1378(-)